MLWSGHNWRRALQDGGQELLAQKVSGIIRVVDDVVTLVREWRNN
jgi:hypothetical protein